METLYPAGPDCCSFLPLQGCPYQGSIPYTQEPAPQILREAQPCSPCTSHLILILFLFSYTVCLGHRQVSSLQHECSGDPRLPQGSKESSGFILSSSGTGSDLELHMCSALAPCKPLCQTPCSERDTPHLMPPGLSFPLCKMGG